MRLLSGEQLSQWALRQQGSSGYYRRRAITFTIELHEKYIGLANFRQRYPLVGRYAGQEIRRRIHGNYLTFYRAAAREAIVLHVLHGAQENEAIF